MMSESDLPGDDDGEGGGYGRPPKATRFKKGQRANPTGRPPGRREPPYEGVLGQMVTIREDGVERDVIQEQAFLLQLAKMAVEGGGVAARTALNLIEEITARTGTLQTVITTITRRIVAPGSVTSALILLRMASKLDPYRETARMLLEPWLVQDALAQLDRILGRAEQLTIVTATRTPQKVKWPEWWSELP
jgi:hypothetical protein